jgi:magnesium transporter
MPWIFCNMFGGFLCATIANVYSEVLAKELILAMFTPLVLALSEAISMQAMTQSVIDMGRRMNLWVQKLKSLFHDLKLFSMLALTSGIIVGTVSLLWGEGLLPAGIIAVSIIVSVTVTALIGVLIPFVIHRWKLDPKIASGPVVLMLADVITITIYLALGSKLLL